MKRLLIFATLAMTLFSCSEPQPTSSINQQIDSMVNNQIKNDTTSEAVVKPLCKILKLAKASPAEVTKALGEPSLSTDKVSDDAGTGADHENHYQGGKVIVLFRKGKAVWFEFDNTIEWKNRFKLLGLDEMKPDKQISPTVYWYESYYSNTKRISMARSETDPTMLKWIIVECS
jgi:hypothetical protein